MIVGGYTLDLYCDRENCHEVESKNIPMRFSGHNKRVCVRQAKQVGWHIGYKRQLCPIHAGKAIGAVQELHGLTPTELANIPLGPFRWKGEEHAD